MATSKKKIREDLERQLFEKSGLDNRPAHFQSMIEDYLTLWDLKEELKKDIKKRGVVYEDNSSLGVPMWKNNPSTKELLMVNKQMLQILKDMEFKITNVGDGGEDEL